MNVKLFIILCPLFLYAGDPMPDLATVLNNFSVDAIRHHVNVLGDDLMAGRATGR